jgi:hypothetical protein
VIEGPYYSGLLVAGSAAAWLTCRWRSRTTVLVRSGCGWGCSFDGRVEHFMVV